MSGERLQSERGWTFERRIGEVRGTASGPLVLCVAGLHGNEPAGVHALQRVLRTLGQRRPALRGDLVGLAGNLAALAKDRRFLDEDLNRVWQPERVERLRREGLPAAATRESREQLELLGQIEAELARARGCVYFLDLHTTSAEGEPFACIGDTLRNRRFALHLPVPILLGIEEQLDGSLLEYVNNLGPATVGVEAGQHASPTSIDRHEAVVWLALAAAGCLEVDALPEIAAAREHLARQTESLPRLLEVRHRHVVHPGDEFRMEPGFQNFQRVDRGELLARDRTGELRACESGRILLPLYQKKGDDGFFLVREIPPVWLGVSWALRRMGLPRLAHWLPGVRRHPRCPESVMVHPLFERWWAVDVFHLLGYRKRRRHEGRLVLSRRRGE